MNEKIILSGMGGQGIISLGYLLANAGMREKKFVSHIPSYGAEMRGGISNCFVTISDEPIYSPVVSIGDTGIFMYDPALIKFISNIKEDGLIILNQDMIKSKVNRDDIKIIEVNANKKAQEMGNVKIANVIMAGIWCGYKKILSPDSIKDQIKETFKTKASNLIDMNIKAFEYGFEIGSNS